jgi:hypothetical protein
MPGIVANDFRINIKVQRLDIIVDNCKMASDGVAVRPYIGMLKFNFVKGFVFGSDKIANRIIAFQLGHIPGGNPLFQGPFKPRGGRFGDFKIRISV